MNERLKRILIVLGLLAAVAGAGWYVGRGPAPSPTQEQREDCRRSYGCDPSEPDEVLKRMVRPS